MNHHPLANHYQIRHTFSAIILSPGRHWKAAAKSGKLLRTPISRMRPGQCESSIAYRRLAAVVVSHHNWSERELLGRQKITENDGTHIPEGQKEELLGCKILESRQHPFSAVLFRVHLICHERLTDSTVVRDIFTQGSFPVDLRRSSGSVDFLNNCLRRNGYLYSKSSYYWSLQYCAFGHSY